MNETKFDLMPEAMRLYDAGLCVLPATVADKRPTCKSWSEYHKAARPDRDATEAMLRGAAAICVLCGRTSGGLEAIDFDAAGVDFANWRELVDLESPGLADRLVVEKSQSGGFHACYRVDGDVPGNAKLATRLINVEGLEQRTEGGKEQIQFRGKWYSAPKPGEPLHVCTIETRGQGGLIVCAPSPGYAITQGDMAYLPPITVAEREVLIRCGCALNEAMETADTAPQHAGKDNVTSPGTDYNHRSLSEPLIEQLLTQRGWALERDADQQYWRRPGKAKGWSATLKTVNDKRWLVVFSTAPECALKARAYDAFGLYAALECNGDFSEAARRLRAEGFGGEPAGGADLSGIYRQMAGESSSADEDIDEQAATDPGPIPDRCLNLPGLLSEIIEFNLRTAMYPMRIHALAGALAIVGTCTGRRIQDYSGCRTNVQINAIAPTGAGKDHARELLRNLFSAAEWIEVLGPERLNSHAGIITEMAANRISCFCVDEWQSMIASVSHSKERHIKEVPGVMKELYSAVKNIAWRPTCYRQAQENITVCCPHFVAYLTGTPAFWEEMPSDLALSGFLGRQFIFQEDVLTLDAQSGASTAEPPASLVDAIKWWKAYHPKGNLTDEYPDPVVIEHTSGARALIDDHKRAIRARLLPETSYRGAIWSRSAQRASQAALIFAASRQTGQLDIMITEEDVSLGIMLSNWSTRYMVWKLEQEVSATTYAKNRKRVLECIPFDPVGITARNVGRRCKHLDPDLRTRILRDLRSTGEADWRESGKTITWFRVRPKVSSDTWSCHRDSSVFGATSAPGVYKCRSTVTQGKVTDTLIVST